jgi:hypothetical protein
MKRWMMGGLVLGCAGLWAGVAVLAQQAPQPQQSENQPGMPTVARTMVLNRSAAEAIPVVIHAGLDVQPVSVLGVPTVTLAADAAVTSRASRQSWEYRRVLVGAEEDPTGALNEAGAQGWEAVAAVSAGPDRSALILKRPR